MAITISPAATEDTIIFYNNHGCPYSHRVHIALEELGIKFEEVTIELDNPREPWYLDINPRGIGPAIKFLDPVTGQQQILTESSIIALFLADSRPSHLLPASNENPLFRARVHFFIDTWNTKVAHFIYTLFRAESEVEKESLSKLWIAAVENEIEPLLKNCAPFFGGSQDLTFAEVIIAPFLLRIISLSNGQILPLSVRQGLLGLPNFSRWAEAVLAHPNVLKVWNEDAVVSRTSQRIANMKARSFRYRAGMDRSYSTDYFSSGPNGAVTPAA